MLVNDRNAIRAPTRDGGVVLSHSSPEITQLLIRPHRFPDGPSIGQKTWSQLRTLARQEVIQLARNYLQHWHEPLPENRDGPLILAGHQPELFHPGVWVKNFAMQGLARSHGGVALHLIVDNDTVKSTSLRLVHPPDLHHRFPYPVFEAYDTWAGEVPYEEQTIRDEALFDSFAERVEAIVTPWNDQPLLNLFWREVQRFRWRESCPGACFAAARRTIERQWQCHNLEVPLGRVCDGNAFRVFLRHVLENLPRFHASYNRCVADYRHRYRIRSRNHPVPDLIREGDWLEAPFWGWRPGQHHRGRIFARRGIDRLEVRCNQEILQHWDEFHPDSTRIRSRALTTTLFARLFLADLFIHGIGGGKYDELTDAIAREFFGFEPPPYLVLSATRLLSLNSELRPLSDRYHLQKQIRDLQFNPDRFLSSSTDATVAALIEQKKHWIARPVPPPGSNRERHDQIGRINRQLSSYLQETRQQLGEQDQQIDQAETVNALLQRRDYSFVLYPTSLLKPFCQQFLSFFSESSH